MSLIKPVDLDALEKARNAASKNWRNRDEVRTHKPIGRHLF